MSDDYIHIIAEVAGFIQDEERQREAVVYFRQIAPEADEVTVSVSESLEFIQCGGNFRKICCPSCGSEIEMEVWQEWMDKDYGKKGFILREHRMPCCDAEHTLHQLNYKWPQGFARCDI